MQHNAESGVSEESSCKSGSIELAPTYEFSHLAVQDNGTGTQASIYSSSVIGADLRWNHLFSPRYAGFFQAGFRHYSLDQPASVATLSNSTPTTWNFELGAIDHFSERLDAFFSIGYGELLSLSGLNSSTLSVDLVRVPRLSLGGRYLFHQSDDFAVGAMAGVSVLLPGQADTYTTHLGNSEALLLYAGEENQSVDLSVGAGVKLNSFNTGFSSIQETSIVIQFGVEFGLTRKKRVSPQG